jgi:hypothetical protein
MSLHSLQAQGRLRPHRTSRKEIDDLLRLAARDLTDAGVSELSPDRRFPIAYDAVVALSTIPLLCAGYETYGASHHWTTFQALPLVMGSELADLGSYFESCRTKRNVSTYDRGGGISILEAEELLTEATGFEKRVEAWLRSQHPDLPRD